MSERQTERQKERERERGEGGRRWESKMPQILKIEIGQGNLFLKKQLQSITKYEVARHTEP